ncbi:MAG: 5'-3' exonuclease H3TH domain-containing protein, partial [Candidatus Diapherotrites archaeon]|nr:5'-3' exonuclease H3TH domain-containing protein [Candidatus Diapherotrites archaeon]
VAWDLAGPTVRHEEFAAYKATRERKAQELYDQIPMIQGILLAYGIPSLSAKGFEADDIIGTIATKNEKAGRKTLIVTGDLDALQLVHDEATEVVVFVKGLSETKTYDEKAVVDRYGLHPDQLIDLKTMLGDTSDNIPGLPGIGEKTAVTLLQEHGTVAKIFAALKRGEIVEKFAKKLEGKEELAKQMERLVTVVRDVDLGGFDFEKAKVEKPDLDKLLPVLRDFEFKNILKRYESGVDDVRQEIPKVKTKKAKVAGTSAALDDLGDELAVLVTAKAEDLFGSTVAAIGASDGEKAFVAEHPSAEKLRAFVEKLARAKRLIAHDYKALLHVLHAAGIDVSAATRVP